MIKDLEFHVPMRRNRRVTCCVFPIERQTVFLSADEAAVARTSEILRKAGRILQIDSPVVVVGDVKPVFGSPRHFYGTGRTTACFEVDEGLYDVFGKTGYARAI